MSAVFSAIRKAGAALSAQLALTFFVPLCLTGLAIVARMHVGLLSLSRIVAGAAGLTPWSSSAFTGQFMLMFSFLQRLSGAHVFNDPWALCDIC